MARAASAAPRRDRRVAADERPERPGVSGYAEVRQLVDDHVVEHRGWRQDEAPVRGRSGRSVRRCPSGRAGRGSSRRPAATPTVGASSATRARSRSRASRLSHVSGAAALD